MGRAPPHRPAPGQAPRPVDDRPLCGREQGWRRDPRSAAHARLTGRPIDCDPGMVPPEMADEEVRPRQCPRTSRRPRDPTTHPATAPPVRCAEEAVMADQIPRPRDGAHGGTTNALAASGMVAGRPSGPPRRGTASAPRCAQANRNAARAVILPPRSCALSCAAKDIPPCKQPDLLLPALPPDRGHLARPARRRPGTSSSGACPTRAWCPPTASRLTSSPTRTTLPGRGQPSRAEAGRRRSHSRLPHLQRAPRASRRGLPPRRPVHRVDEHRWRHRRLRRAHRDHSGHPAPSAFVLGGAVRYQATPGASPPDRAAVEGAMIAEVLATVAMLALAAVSAAMVSGRQR